MKDTSLDQSQLFDGLARRLAVDLRTVGARFAVEVVPDPYHDEACRVAFELGFDPPDASALAIRFSVDGHVSTELGIYRDEEPGVGFANIVNHIQTSVMEELREQWPICPGHRHALSPASAGELPAWCCPTSGEVVVLVGDLRGP
jgi:hypothetical protein